MPAHVFVLDTSAAMMQAIQGSLRRLDTAKAFVESFVKARERDPSHRGDTYALVTTAGPNGAAAVIVDREWPFDAFLAAVRAATPRNLPCIPQALATAMACARAHRLATLGDITAMGVDAANPNAAAAPVAGCDVPGVAESADIIVVLGTDHWCEAPGEPMRAEPLTVASSQTLRAAIVKHAPYTPSPRASDVRVHCAVMRMQSDAARKHVGAAGRQEADSSRLPGDSWCILAQVCKDTAGLCVGATSLRGAALAAERVANTAALSSVVVTITMASLGGETADAATSPHALLLRRPLHFERAATVEPPPFDATTGRRQTYESLGRPLPPVPHSHVPSHWALPLIGSSNGPPVKDGMTSGVSLDYLARPQLFVDTNASASAVDKGTPPLAGYPVDAYEIDLESGVVAVADVEGERHNNATGSPRGERRSLRDVLSASLGATRRRLGKRELANAAMGETHRARDACWPVYAIGTAAVSHGMGPDTWTSSAADAHRAIGRLRLEGSANNAVVILEICGHGFATLWPLLRELRAKSTEWDGNGNATELTGWLRRLENWARRLAPPHAEATRRALQRCGVGPRLISALPLPAEMRQNSELEAVRWRKAREVACSELDARMRQGSAVAAAEARSEESLRRSTTAVAAVRRKRKATQLGSSALMHELNLLAVRPDANTRLVGRVSSLAALPVFTNPFDSGPDNAAFRAEASLLPLLLRAGVETAGGTRPGAAAAARVRRLEATSAFERSHRVPAAAMGEYRMHMLQRPTPLRDPMDMLEEHRTAASDGSAPAHVLYRMQRLAANGNGAASQSSWPSPLAFPRRARGVSANADLALGIRRAGGIRPLGIVADEADAFVGGDAIAPATPNLSRDVKRKREEDAEVSDGDSGAQDGAMWTSRGICTLTGALALAKAYTLAREGASDEDVRGQVASSVHDKLMVDLGVRVHRVLERAREQ